MKSLFEKSLNLISTTTEKLLQDFSDRFTLVQDTIKGIPYIAYLHKNASSKQRQFDEKHYFVVPYKLSETGFALHTIRTLPRDVPEINQLPKRRVFHFASDYVEDELKHYLVEEARVMARDQADSSRSSLERLADSIDQLDKKMTYGLLAIGGIAAFINPVVGLGIASKALIPGFMGVAAKYGLRPIGEKLTQHQIENQISQAETAVIKSFKESTTLKVINPILEELHLALKTDQSEHDPIIDFDLSSQKITELETERWRDLTVVAIKHVYDRIINDTTKHQAANLGPEDIRWLRVLLS